MKKNNNFLITGATSFTGNNFIQTNNIYNYLAYIKGNKNNSDNIEYVSDLNILSEKIKDKSIDTCIHIANFKDKITDKFDTDIEINFLKQIKSSGISKIIYLSSYWVDLKTLENNEYVLHKKNIEFEIKKKFTFVILRIGDIYGANDKRQKLLPYLLKNENQDNIELEGHPKNLIKPVSLNSISSFITELFSNTLYKNKTVDFFGEDYYLEDFINLFKESRDKKFVTTYKGNTNYQNSYKSTSDETIIVNEDLYNNLKALH